jgi:hypothetical protein
MTPHKDCDTRLETVPISSIENKLEQRFSRRTAKPKRFGERDGHSRESAAVNRPRMNLDTDTLQRNSQTTLCNFILAELDLAETFCRISLGTTKAEKAVRYANHARQAYVTALRFQDKLQWTSEMRREIGGRRKQLEPLMAELLEQAYPAE